jgi:hypothetical protein
MDGSLLRADGDFSSFSSLSGGYLRERISSLLRNELSMLCSKAFFWENLPNG